MPNSEGRRYIEGFFFLPLNISALAVVQSWFWYLSAPNMERLWLPWSLLGTGVLAGEASLLVLDRGVEPDLGAGLLVGVFGREMEDLPEETEETEERGVDCLLILFC